VRDAIIGGVELEQASRDRQPCRPLAAPARGLQRSGQRRDQQAWLYRRGGHGRRPRREAAKQRCDLVVVVAAAAVVVVLAVLARSLAPLSTARAAAADRLLHRGDRIVDTVVAPAMRVQEGVAVLTAEPLHPNQGVASLAELCLRGGRLRGGRLRGRIEEVA
jgi:hypothetical protein